MAAPQITPLPDAPDKRDDPLNFEEKADEFLGALPTFGDEANTLATAVNGYANNALISETNSAASELAAVGAANYKGEWSTLTGALNIPASVSNDGVIWVLKANIADVTASEPTSINTDWINVSFIDENGDANILGDIDIGGDAIVVGTVSIGGKDIQQQGVLTYSPTVDYLAEISYVAKSGDLYKCLVNNGPASAVVDPVGNPATWYNMKPLYNAYLKFSDRKTSGTAGGASSATTTTVRDVNTKDADTANIGSFAANQRTLPAGTYRVMITCPSYRTERSRIHLYDATAATVLVLGIGHKVDSTNLVSTNLTLSGRFTIAATSALEVRHYTEAADANGFGLAVSDGHGDEVYTIDEYWRES